MNSSKVLLVRHSRPGDDFEDMAKETAVFLMSYLVGKRVKILSSPISRAKKTADILGTMLKVGVEEELSLSDGYMIDESVIKGVQEELGGGCVILVTHLPNIEDFFQTNPGVIKNGSVWEKGQSAPIFVPKQKE